MLKANKKGYGKWTLTGDEEDVLHILVGLAYAERWNAAQAVKMNRDGWDEVAKSHLDAKRQLNRTGSEVLARYSRADPDWDNFCAWVYREFDNA